MRHLIGREEELARLDVFRREVTVVRECAPVEPKRETPRLSQNALHALIHIARHPIDPLMIVYKTVGLQGSQALRALKLLLSLNMIRLLSLVRTGRGARPQIPVLLESGIAELAQRGIEPMPKAVARGEDEHDRYCRIVAACEQHDDKKTSFEAWFGNKAFDVLSETNGKYTGFEIVTSGSAAWNAEQALRAARVTGIERVFVTCKEAALVKGITAKIAELDPMGPLQAKIEVKFLGEFVVRWLEIRDVPRSSDESDAG